MTDKLLLSILRNRTDYESLSHSLDLDVYSKETAQLIREFGSYYREFPEAIRVEPDVFLSWLWQFKRPSAKDAERETTTAVIHAIQEPVDTATRDGISRKIKEKEYATKLANLIQQFRMGQDISLYEAAQDMAFEFGRVLAKADDSLEFDGSFTELFEDSRDESRYMFPLDCLNNAMGGAPRKRQIIFAARPDAGKTSAIAAFVASFAPQVYKEFGTSRPILVLTNEGDANEVTRRVLQAGIGWTNSQIKAKPEQAYALFNRAVGPWTAVDRIVRVININGMGVHDLERLYQIYKPSIVVVDMLDNVHGFEFAARHDLMLEYRYRWQREMADKYDFLSIPTSQINKEYDDEEYPPDHCLKDSGTGKQGACDSIILMGRKRELDAAKENAAGAFQKGSKQAALEQLQFTRYISTPKQKIPGRYGARRCRNEVLADFNRCRLLNPNSGGNL